MFNYNINAVKITENDLEELFYPFNTGKTLQEPLDLQAKESLRTRLLRWQFNLYPAFRRTGGRITYISGDLKRLCLQIPLNWKTRNYVGTIFGGSMYGAVDPIYMIMFIKLLGREYVVWDKAASIRYKKPACSPLIAEFVINEEELISIRKELERTKKTDRAYHIDLRDENNTICASITKTLHFRKKSREISPKN